MDCEAPEVSIGEMMEERAAAKVDLEQMAPVIVVPAMEIKDNWDEWRDIGDGVAEREGGRDSQGGGGGGGGVVWLPAAC